MIKIASITIHPEDQPYADHRQGEFIRVSVPQATLVVGHGIQGDAKAGGNPSRQLNLLSDAWLRDLAEQGYKSAPGMFGEQIILAGLAADALHPGDLLQLGAVAVIEITKARKGCLRLERAQDGKGQFAGTDVGMMSKVVTGGEIRVGDAVKVLAVDIS